MGTAITLLTNFRADVDGQTFEQGSRAAANMGLNEIFKKEVKRSSEVLSFSFSFVLMQKMQPTCRQGTLSSVAFFAASVGISIPLFKNIVNP